MIIWLIGLVTTYLCVALIYWDAKRWNYEHGNSELELLKLYKAPKETYTIDHHNLEIKINKLGRGLICPWCEIGGEYGPRDAKQARKYRACKNCGIFQNVDGLKEQARLAHCPDCGVGSWTLNKDGKECDKCHRYIKF